MNTGVHLKIRLSRPEEPQSTIHIIILLIVSPLVRVACCREYNCKCQQIEMKAHTYYFLIKIKTTRRVRVSNMRNGNDRQSVWSVAVVTSPVVI